ncbi:hypothetical protein ACX9R5_03600 [Rathayibacter sp. CAU 1779]
MSSPSEDPSAAPTPSPLRLCFSAPAIAVLAAGVIVTVIGEFLAIPDSQGETVWGYLPFAGPVLAGVFGVLQPLWRGGRDMQTFTVPMFLLPFVAAVLCSVTELIVWVLPAFQNALAVALARDPWHYWFDGGPVWMPILLVGYAVGLMAAAVVWIGVSIPVLAISRTRDFVKLNMLDPDPRYLRRARISGVATSVMLLGIVATVTCFVLGHPAFGWLFVVVVVGSAATVVDAARRSQAPIGGARRTIRRFRDPAPRVGALQGANSLEQALKAPGATAAPARCRECTLASGVVHSRVRSRALAASVEKECGLLDDGGHVGNET